MEMSKKDGLGFTLARLGFISDEEITQFLSLQYRVPMIDLTTHVPDRQTLSLLSRERCERDRVVPVSRVNDATFILAMADPTNERVIEAVRTQTGLAVEVVIASERSITEAIARYYTS